MMSKGYLFPFSKSSIHLVTILLLKKWFSLSTSSFFSQIFLIIFLSSFLSLISSLIEHSKQNLSHISNEFLFLSWYTPIKFLTSTKYAVSSKVSLTQASDKDSFSSRWPAGWFKTTLSCTYSSTNKYLSSDLITEATVICGTHALSFFSLI